MRWVRHVAQRGDVRINYIILIGGVICRDNINMEPKGTYFVCANCILLIHGNVYMTGRAGRSGFRIPSWANDFSSPKRSDCLCGLGFVSWPVRKADHSPPSSTEVKNEWSYAPTPPLCLSGVDEGKFTFAFSWWPV